MNTTSISNLGFGASVNDKYHIYVFSCSPAIQHDSRKEIQQKTGLFVSFLLNLIRTKITHKEIILITECIN